jgi:DNA-binding NarL/FixJ family response regulator
LIVDDHGLFRTGLRTLLEPEGYEVVTAPSGEVALRLAASFRPDVVLMDVHMPGLSGIEATRTLLAERPELPVLMLTVVEKKDSILEAIHAGAAGYLLKDADLRDIVSAVEAAVAGHSAISPPVAATLISSLRSAPAPVASIVPLSDREREVLSLIADGYDNAAIAQRLYVSPSTARNLVSRVLGKLGVENRVQAATYALRHGLASGATERGVSSGRS